MEEECEIVVREFDPSKDSARVEEVERRCEVGSSGGKLSLFTDLLGDPICRVRHSPVFLMLVAEIKSTQEIVGMIRGCIKIVTSGNKLSKNGNLNKLLPVPAKVAYILGLRVSPSHRRMGIGLKLVNEIEDWFIQNGVEYCYLATENDNSASVHLFTDKCGYSKFRTPSILVNPVFAHRLTVSGKVTIIKLKPSHAESLYRRRFSTTEFFPQDVDSILQNRLSLGTFLAVPRGTYTEDSWPGYDEFLANPPDSWAILSVWNSKEVFNLEVRGASIFRRIVAKTTRILDGIVPFCKLPSIPAIFRPFGLHFLYGLGGEGPRAEKLVKALCAHAHNLAKESGCGVVATEVASREPLRSGIPHWKRLSCEEDLWCIKRLSEGYSDGAVGDWTKSPPGLSIFVDPREF